MYYTVKYYHLSFPHGVLAFYKKLRIYQFVNDTKYRQTMFPKCDNVSCAHYRVKHYFDAEIYS
jgi:hypothetical protein